MLIDKLSYQAINLQKIDEMIVPISSIGRACAKVEKPFVTGTELALKRKYQIIQELMQSLQKDYNFQEIATGALKHLEQIDQTILKAKSLHLLELYEIYEIKNFIYFSAIIKELLDKEELSHIHQIPDFSELFTYLDIDGQKSPSFHLSKLYSSNYAKLKEIIADWKLKRNYELESIFEIAKQELEVDKLEDRIVVSRYNHQLNEKLQKSSHFSLESENFANNSYKIRKSPKLLEIETELEAKEQELDLAEKAIRIEITKVISVYCQDLTVAISEIGQFDLALIKAIFGNKISGVIPQINNEKKFIIKESINLPIQIELAKKNLKYQPIDIEVLKNINVLTGANMGGKTTVLKTLGQFIYMASKAIPLPCKEANLPLFDFIFFSGIESSRMDLSSFGSEVVAVNEAMNKPGAGLFLLDEFARGTNPLEGEAFSSAVLKSFIGKEAVVYSATHFTQPAKLIEANHYRIVGISKENIGKLSYENNLQSRLEELHKYMNYSLEKVDPGAEPPHAALIIAAILGIESDIIQKAKDYLNNENSEV